MQPPEYYQGREQTYLKHFFLEQYLERVAYHIGFFHKDFVYIDGFSGPWKSEDEAFEDTSFMIAIQKMENVHAGLVEHQKQPRMRHIFIEKDPEAYRHLEQAIAGRPNVITIPGEFEASIPRILQEIGKSFSLCFIDPTGWTGFGLKQITPLLQHRPGEVIVNFMFDHINRFLDDPASEPTFDDLFGGTGWQDAIQPGPGREESIVRLYSQRMARAGGFTHVTHTRILKPTQDRSYFYLIYGTRHPKGVVEFRAVEKKAIDAQERVRSGAKERNRVERTGQLELLPSTEEHGLARLDQERGERLAVAEAQLRRRLGSEGRIEYLDLLASLLVEPLVWESDVKKLIGRLEKVGEVTVEGRSPKQRVPKQGNIIVARG